MKPSHSALWCLLACTLLAACVDARDASDRQLAERAQASGVACAEPQAGCSCDGNQRPIACRVDPEPGRDTKLCYEGTRSCRAGVWSGCEDVHAFANPKAASETTALVDQSSAHPRCSTCDPECFRVTDTLDPADGPLASAFANGVRYHASGAGITLAPVDGGTADGGSLPSDGIIISAPEGVVATSRYAGSYRPLAADVYMLVDQSTRMAEETLWLYDSWDRNGPLLPATTPCASGDQSLLSGGISGAFACMFPQPAAGAGMFRDIPFEPYATDTKLPAAERTANAKLEIAFRSQQGMSSNLALVKDAIAGFGGVESSGDPDFAASTIPALYALATGQGFATGLGRTGVPNAAACPAGRFGYPCFRDDSDALVVLVTDAPMHNGPKPSSYAYDYDPAKLTTTMGSSTTDIPVPPTNDLIADAFDLSSNAESILATYVGSTAGFGNEITANVAGCMANDAAADAVFRFDVSAPNGALPITLSTEGSSFATTISVHDGPPPLDESLAGNGDANELFSSATSFGNVRGRAVVTSGDTTKPSDAANDMSADYQGGLFGGTCGANSLAPDAAFAFDVGDSGAPVDLSLALDMGADRGVLSIYDATSNLPLWPLRSSPAAASGNDDAHASPYVIATGSQYVTITGDSSGLAADYDASALGGALCSPANAAKDAAFKLHVDGTHTLRFDTEGSSFDTVLSLHSAPPVAVTGNWTTHKATDTHDNANETTGSAYDVGDMIGRQDIYEGDTSGMAADLDDSASCGLDKACGDAVYTVQLDRRSTLRFGVTGQGYVPGLEITRADPSAFQPRVHTLAAGEWHSCALSGGSAYCWGSDSVGQLGNGPANGTGDSGPAVQVTGVSDAVDLASGARHACVVLKTGNVQCWGQNINGQLGDNTDNDAPAPVATRRLGPANGTLGRAIQVSAGLAHTCALLDGGHIACWGDNARSQLGDGTANEHRQPVLVSGSTVYSYVAAGGNHTCAIRASDRGVSCWGEGQYGQVGDGSTAAHTQTTPRSIDGLSNVTDLSLGQNHACAVLSSGRVMCWGRNGAAQLGIGNTTDQATPVAVQTPEGAALLDNAKGDIAAGTSHTCTRMIEGYVYCWGNNTKAQLGDGTMTNRGRPVGVQTLIDVEQLSSRVNHSCALRKTGDLVCWGDGTHEQLGDNDTALQSKPVAAEPGGSGAKVSFGNGAVDLAFSNACDSRGQAPEAGCTYGQSASGESYFFCANQSRTWHTSGLSCQNSGMQLLDVDTPGENTFVASHLNASKPAWIGVKRESSNDWLNLLEGDNFTNLDGQTVWHTDVVSVITCPLFGACTSSPTKGHFINDLLGDPAAPDLVDSSPWSPASTWISALEPNPIDSLIGSNWGNNCVTLNSQAKWQTDNCSAVPKPSCGFLGLGCLLSALLGAVANLVGGVLGWLSGGLIDLNQLVHFGSGGLFSSPHFSGGVERAYVCEQHDETRDVTLDPGTYYVVVKGIADGTAGNVCSGPYQLKISDVGPPPEGFLTCDDNSVAETTSSAITTTLDTGDYYLVLKGKHATDAGKYALTVRDTQAVPSSELACDASSGTNDPAQLTFSAQPGHQYYALVKGDAPTDKGPYSLAIRDLTRVTGQRLACDASSGPGGSSLLNVPLGTGSYYAVLKGTSPSAEGDYRLTIGGAQATTATFVPPTYTETVKALNDRGVRVATVLSCEGTSCDDAHAQADLLAADTKGRVRVANDAQDVPREVVAAVQELESLDTVTGQLRFTPSANPGFTDFGALSAPSAACTSAADGNTLLACAPGSRPSYDVTLQNPLISAVPPGPGPQGSYQFTLHLEGQRDGSTLYSRDVPVYVVPSGGATAGSYGQGSYAQDLDARSCQNRGNLAPSWQDFFVDADVRPDTTLELFACSATEQDDLDGCDDALGSASGFVRVATLSAGTSLGTPCTAADQSTVCPGGYCSPYTGICQYVEAASCVTDGDCPGTATGRCHEGPSAATLGKTCLAEGSVANLSSALDAGDLQPFLRVRIDLRSFGDGSRTPSLFDWEVRYRCRSVL